MRRSRDSSRDRCPIRTRNSRKYRRWVTPLALLGGAIILLVTLWKTRERDIEDSWTPLMASALLASPLGWLYYGCWLLPGRRPFRLLFQAPMLWVPVFYVKLPAW